MGMGLLFGVMERSGIRREGCSHSWCTGLGSAAPCPATPVFVSSICPRWGLWPHWKAGPVSLPVAQGWATTLGDKGPRLAPEAAGPFSAAQRPCHRGPGSHIRVMQSRYDCPSVALCWPHETPACVQPNVS